MYHHPRETPSTNTIHTQKPTTSHQACMAAADASPTEHLPWICGPDIAPRESKSPLLHVSTIGIFSRPLDLRRWPTYAITRIPTKLPQPWPPPTPRINSFPRHIGRDIKSIEGYSFLLYTTTVNFFLYGWLFVGVSPTLSTQPTTSIAPTTHLAVMLKSRMTTFPWRCGHNITSGDDIQQINRCLSSGYCSAAGSFWRIRTGGAPCYYVLLWATSYQTTFNIDIQQ